ncbi:MULTISPECIES: hypothetical protein [unclassified Oceanispirochaeta]|uniref:hypothetical protein n=1 Tax=unclassified Oceanispirochaeta TaxID=2635722 RepID=UPI000E09CBD2|nr:MULTISPECIES: hypothetical protein [unclassified Oceanispirochaeta]MBF9014355.1 hypothetical protein [Oceanispirochaeta sp. M2]NPD71241.1 hypothetical protein [Oceanispirochaeta sp. M1]RDG33626.1 hypothetical protein DV872_03920 [Oceanispirochaeta sp. M1]
MKFLKSLLLILSAFFILFAFVSCEEEAAAAAGGGLTDSERSQVLGTATTAMSTAVSEAMSSISYGGALLQSNPEDLSRGIERTTYDINYTGNGFSVTGTFSTSYQLTITFNNYSSSGVTINGSCSYSGSAGGISSTASFTIKYDGYTYSFRWTLNMDSSGNFTGSYTIDGESYNYNDSSSDDSSDDSGATQFCFYITSELGHGYIYVYLNGSSVGTITKYFEGGQPPAGTAGTVTVQKSPGSYTFTASSQDGTTWGPNTYTLQEGQTFFLELTN